MAGVDDDHLAVLGHAEQGGSGRLGRLRPRRQRGHGVAGQVWREIDV
ncbi:MAG TPA: hypothetical protein PLG36_09795 [Trueperaceae bacterium]|nr:hypothetical protein [Trueperaceae bacterium]